MLRCRMRWLSMSAAPPDVPPGGLDEANSGNGTPSAASFQVDDENAASNAQLQAFAGTGIMPAATPSAPSAPVYRCGSRV